MTHLCQSLKDDGFTSFISSSGGNAGLSVANIGNILQVHVKVIVPESTKPMMLEKIRECGAEVMVHGRNWDEADQLARDIVEHSKNAAYISPFDHPKIWEGHSSMIDELTTPPDAVVVSVGGGGLLCGVILGLERKGWGHVKIIAVETTGTDSFGSSMRAGRLVKLECIRGVATSLGALQVTPHAMKLSKNHGGGVVPVAVTDEQAVNACTFLLHHHRILVEPACGAALACLLDDGAKERFVLDESSNIVVIICGGSGVTPELLQTWKDSF